MNNLTVSKATPRLIDDASVGAALLAAVEVGLLEALREPATAAACANALGLHLRALELLLPVLEVIGVVRREAAGWTLTSEARDLDNRMPGGLPTVLGLVRHLPTFLRTGESAARMDGSPADRERSYRGAVGALRHLFQDGAEALAAELGPAATLLDVGAGSGVWSLAMAARDAATLVTAVDFPAVLDTFLSHAAELGLEARVATLTGDYHHVPFDTGRWSRVVLANVLHLETADAARSLVAKAARAVERGGEVVVVDSFPSGTATGDRAHALYALTLAMRTVQGCAHERAAIEGWMREAGLTAPRLVPLSSSIEHVAALVAKKG